MKSPNLNPWNGRAAALAACSLFCAAHAEPATFEKKVLADQYYCDGIRFGDFNRDGETDVVAGPFWHAGPAFTVKHAYYEPAALVPEASPSNNMFTYVHDFNGDDWPDILVLGRVHMHQAFWYENPKGEPGFWKKHFVFHRIKGESPPFTDLDGDGRPELICHWNDSWGWAAPDWKRPDQPWNFHPIKGTEGEWPQFYHGTGVGDVNGDGRADLILNDGWWEQPENHNAPWKKHPFQFGERGGAQMFADDADGDGDADIITSLDGHGWGLAWFEQIQQNGERTFRKHMIMGSREEEARYGVAFSQPHALELADVNGDGLKDIVTGKRRWAHGPTGDVEPNADPVVYWFELKRTAEGGARYIPHLIGKNSGLGVQISVADLNQDQKPDILTASKLGSFVFLQK